MSNISCNSCNGAPPAVEKMNVSLLPWNRHTFFPSTYQHRHAHRHHGGCMGYNGQGCFNRCGGYYGGYTHPASCCCRRWRPSRYPPCRYRCPWWCRPRRRPLPAPSPVDGPPIAPAEEDVVPPDIVSNEQEDDVEEEEIPPILTAGPSTGGPPPMSFLGGGNDTNTMSWLVGGIVFVLLALFVLWWMKNSSSEHTVPKCATC